MRLAQALAVQWEIGLRYLDAAQTMADLIERARKQPKLVAQELNAYALV